MSDQIPTRLCCGQKHTGPVCPDGLVMCQLCFERVTQDKLRLFADGTKENVCIKCHDAEVENVVMLLKTTRARLAELEKIAKKAIETGTPNWALTARELRLKREYEQWTQSK